MTAPRQHAAAATPLAHSNLLVTITDLIAEYELRHEFRNDGDEPIEAIWSFPIPLDAAFLGMQARLAGVTRVAQVQTAARATAAYDDAIASGDSAVLLEQLEPGLLCVNLGNLGPHEDGEIVLRFAAPLAVAAHGARFSLPLAYRPRYGRSLLDPLAEPSHDFAVEHPLDARIRIHGLLAAAPIHCASHPAQFRREGETACIDIDSALLDRDLVLNFALHDAIAPKLHVIADGERAIGVLTAIMPAADGVQPRPCDICLVLDGSGSMEGDAIRQSRLALIALANALGDEDRIQVLRFGSTHNALFRRPLHATLRVRAALHELSPTVQADLGGTEMDAALEAAIATLGRPDDEARNRVIILVTDGAVHAHALAAARERALACGVRIFVVAVGSSAGADVLEPLALATGGTLERAVPAEPIADGVLRQLQRARLSPVEPRVCWGRGATALPLRPLYAGDALIALALLPATAQPRTVRLQFERTGPAQALTTGAVETAPAWRAWAGLQRYRAAPSDARRKTLALHYGLISAQTSAVLVHERAADARGGSLPRIVQVPQMVPAGFRFAAHSLPLAARLVSTSGVYSSLMCAPTYDPGAADDHDLAELPPSTPQPAAPPPLTAERRAVLDAALLRVLRTVLFVQRRTSIEFDELVNLLDPRLRADAKRRLAELRCFDGDVHSLLRTFLHLEANCPPGAAPPLEDDQELTLARLQQGVARVAASVG